MFKLQPTQWVAVAALPVTWGIISLLLFPVSQPFLTGILVLALAGAGLLAYVLARRVAGAPMPTGTITILVLAGIVIPLFFFLWSHLAAHRWFSGAPGGNNNQGKKKNNSSPFKQPVSLAPVLAEVRAELEKANTFFELPALTKVPIPQPAAAGSADLPMTYAWIPPGEQVHVNWESSSNQFTDGNYLREKGQIIDSHHIYPASPHGEIIIIEGHYPRPDCLARASPIVEIMVQADKGKFVFATTPGKKNTAGKWEPVAVGSGFWLWGKLPNQSVNWQCSITLTDAIGKPVTTDDRKPVFVCKEDTKGKIQEEDRHPLSWEKHSPPGTDDKSTMLFTAKDVPAGLNYLVIPTKSKEPRRIYVALILSK